MENFVSYKYDDRKENKDTSTIEDTVTEGKQVEFTDYNMSLLRSIDTEDGRIEYPYMNIIEDFGTELKNMCTKYTMTDEEFRRYRYRPDLFCHDMYGKSDYEFVLLLVNGINVEKDFNKKTIRYIDPDQIDIVLSFIRNAEEELFNMNRDTYKSNKYFC